MKKTRKMMCIIVALVALFVFSGVAFASNADDWSSTKCLYGFTTSGEITKSSGTEWYILCTSATQADWAGHPEWVDHYVKYYWKSSSGVKMTDQYEAHVGDTSDANDIESIYEGTEGYSPIKLRIDNPHPGHNMVSKGHYMGKYY